MLNGFLAGFRESTVSALLGGQVDDDRAGAHGLNHVLGYQDWRPFPGNESGRDDHIRAGHAFFHQLLLLLIELLGLGFGIAGLFLGILGFQGQFDKFAAQAFDLLLDHWPSVVRLDDGAETASGTDRLQTGDARADDEHASGS